eukprot:Em0009g506a
MKTFRCMANQRDHDDSIVKHKLATTAVRDCSTSSTSGREDLSYPPSQKFTASITPDDLSDFTALYREHCKAILDVVQNLQFQMVENLWHHFWLCKNLEGWLTSSIHGYPTKSINSRVRVFGNVVSIGVWTQRALWLGFHGRSIFKTLRCYMSLNHLAQAARAVLQNPSQISQMLADLNGVDFANVQEQASWVFPVIRDMTLRSAASFGSFHLIRLLYDEYMFFLIEHKVADAMGKITIDIIESMQHSRAILRADSFDNGQKTFYQLPRGLDFALEETVIKRTQVAITRHIRSVYAERDKHFNPFVHISHLHSSVLLTQMITLISMLTSIMNEEFGTLKIC